ncbi:glycosyltransferase [Rubellicoccus peritrichatus]|uniref:Glycosyltransferase n=1 Tax=Rubellicoccus peritrichatus TaxID=3080537 RepID=A0AAQ3QX14_9BACT|nr:glycosyltransferase [Puniceicoccus sp. CR14]WOO42527.1 glycosyltransferase [Puniceicoccus sp. CR14]
MKQPTILHFTGNSIDEGGVFTYIRNVAPHNGCRNVLVVAKDFKQVRRPYLPLLRIPSFESESLYHPNTIVWCHRLAIGFYRLLEKHPDAIFHGHSRSGMLIALLLNFWGQRRVVVSVHANARQRWFYRWAKSLLEDRMFFLCPSMKSHYGIRDRNWKSCMPGSVSQLVSASRLQRQDDSLLLLGGLGAITPWKRWHLILEALKQLPVGLRSKLRFIHHGKALDDDASKAYEEKLKTLTCEYGLEQFVEWRGFTKDTESFFSEVNALVSPSESEPFSLSILEALFADVPVISADTGGATDIVVGNENGILFRDNDSGALTEVLERVLLNEQKLPLVNHESLKAFCSDIQGKRWKLVYYSMCR